MSEMVFQRVGERMVERVCNGRQRMPKVDKSTDNFFDKLLILSWVQGSTMTLELYLHRLFPECKHGNLIFFRLTATLILMVACISNVMMQNK